MYSHRGWVGKSAAALLVALVLVVTGCSRGANTGGAAPAKGSSPAVWAAGTSAKYDQPSWDRVTDQALTVWNIMFAVLKAEHPQTVLAAPQDWKQYRLFITAPLAKISAFDEGVRTAKTDADTQRVFQALYAGIVFRVFDLKQQKFIDDKEFVKVHFTK